MSAANFKNCRNIMITGASRGLGLQMVECLATSGNSPAKIIASARNPSGAQVTFSTHPSSPNHSFGGGISRNYYLCVQLRLNNVPPSMIDLYDFIVAATAEVGREILQYPHNHPRYVCVC